MQFRVRVRDLAIVAAIALVTVQTACGNLPWGQQQATATDTHAEENVIRQADLEWSKAASGKNMDKVVSYYAEDGALYPPNAPISAGIPAIKVAWTGMMNLPGFQVNWVPSRVEVAKSGDLGWATGTYTMTTTLPGSSGINDHGKYVEVWKKQADGNWKAEADIFNSDLPAGGASTAPGPRSRSMEIFPSVPGQ